MAEPADFRAVQLGFAAWIRDPAHAPAPEGVEERRLAIYRELFFNNLSDLLARTFPVLRKLLGGDAWQALIRDWLVRHRARTPLFLELPREFLHYLEHERATDAGDPAWVRELAHYEWIELALAIDEREPQESGVDVDGDLLDGMPVVSELAWPLVYRWPVHRIGPEYRPDVPPQEPTRLVVVRGRDERVSFLEINVVTARLIELLSEPDALRTGRACLEQIAAELSHPRPEVVIEGGAGTLGELRRRDVLLGTRMI